MTAEVANLLQKKYRKFNQKNFIENDPIQIPHQFSKQQDIEIMAFFAATLAWGQRVTIINNCKRLVEYFDNAPHDFVCNHQESDLKKLVDFKHRTFNYTDLLYFVHFLKKHYTSNRSLESAFLQGLGPEDKNVQGALEGFHNYFCASPYFPVRTRKHVATPARKSACKRLNMFLRWMVRHDNNKVDFGIWKNIQPSQLIIPLDVHVQRVALELGILKRTQSDFSAALELTEVLKELDPKDPVKFDYALFGMGVEEKL